MVIWLECGFGLPCYLILNPFMDDLLFAKLNALMLNLQQEFI